MWKCTKCEQTAGSSNGFSFLKYKTETLFIRCFSSTDWARSMASSSLSHVPIASPGHVLRGHEPVQILKDLQYTEWSLLGRFLPSLQRNNNRVIKQSTSIHMCIFETDPLSESTYNVVCVLHHTTFNIRTARLWNLKQLPSCLIIDLFFWILRNSLRF